METQESKKVKGRFDKFSRAVTTATGRPGTFIIALCSIIVWACCGPFFHFSDTWQLVINTSTTIITFLMVFVIQQSQNRDSLALQLKLNELIAANKYASNHLVDIEDLTEEELQVVKRFYVNLAKIAAKDADIKSSHSFDEAIKNQEEKSDVQETTD